MDVQPTCPRDEWVERLSVRLRELQPGISHPQALDVASAAFAFSRNAVASMVAVIPIQLSDQAGRGNT